MPNEQPRNNSPKAPTTTSVVLIAVCLCAALVGLLTANALLPALAVVLLAAYCAYLTWGRKQHSDEAAESQDAKMCYEGAEASATSTEPAQEHAQIQEASYAAADKASASKTSQAKTAGAPQAANLATGNALYLSEEEELGQTNPEAPRPSLETAEYKNALDTHEEELEQAKREAEERIEIVDRMLSHAEDMFALSRDLVHSDTEDEAFTDIVAMLQRCPAVEREDVPAVKPIKLARTKRYWITHEDADQSPKLYDDLMAIEAIFNINQDLQRQAACAFDAAPRSLDDRLRRVLFDFATQTISHSSDNDYAEVAYPDMRPENIVGEWALRNAIASAVENTASPFRIGFLMRSNASRGLVRLSLEVPRPACFSFVSEDPQEQQKIACDYALRAALFMARTALEAPLKSNPIVRAVVSCHYHGEEEILLSMDANPSTLSALKQLCEQAIPLSIQRPLPALRIDPSPEGLKAVAPHLGFHDELLHPDRYNLIVETSEKRCFPRLALATGAKLEKDLGYREEAFKEAAFAQLDDLGTSASTAVARFKELSEQSERDDIKAACERCMRALAEGSVDANQLEHLHSIFMGTGDLAAAISFGMGVYRQVDPVDAQQAVEYLRRALTPALQISMMDDTEHIYRFFPSCADRLFFNLMNADTREVKLVPRQYYSANELMAHLLCLLEKPDEAEPYADEVLRIAPLSANAAVTKARVLEYQSKVFEAVNLMNDAITKAATVHDAALCYYRMAYLQWKLGKNQLALANYRVVLELRSEISAQAAREMQELLNADSSLHTPDFDEACKTLEQAGLNIWELDDRRNELARAAVLCTDQDLFPCAAQLTMNLLEYKQDDAVACIFKSLVDF